MKVLKESLLSAQKHKLRGRIRRVRTGIFRPLADDCIDDVREESLVHELVDCGHFTLEVHAYIIKTQKNGQIFERGADIYSEPHL